MDTESKVSDAITLIAAAVTLDAPCWEKRKDGPVRVRRPDQKLGEDYTGLMMDLEETKRSLDEIDERELGKALMENLKHWEAIMGRGAYECAQQREWGKN